MALDILDDQQDFDGVREVLGVTPLDVSDVMIQSRHFGWHSEYEIKQQLTNWAALLADPDTMPMVKLATLYYCAYLIADSFAHGGTVGNTDEVRERNWDGFASQMEALSNHWLDQAKRQEQGPSALVFLDRSEDIRAVRELLGAEYRNLREETILNLPFGGRAEQDIRNEVSGWQAMWQGESLDPANSVTGWVAGTATTVGLESVVRPYGYGPSSVKLTITALTNAISDSVHTLTTPVDLTQIDVDSLVLAWLAADPTPLWVAIRLQFQSVDDYAEWDVVSMISGFQRVELDYARPDRGHGTPDGTVTAVHVLVGADATPYTGVVLLRDVRVGDQQTIDNIRLAAQYGTASYLAQSYAANSAGSAAEASRWADYAASLRDYTYQLMGDIDASDTDPAGAADMDGFVKVARRGAASRLWHDVYPPVWSYSSPQTD